MKHLDEALARYINPSNYSNVAFDSSKKKKESFRENSKFVDMLRKERKNISRYNKLFPVYLVFNDKTLEDLVVKKPINIAQLSSVKGFTKEKMSLFGEYLINKIKAFLDQNENLINTKNSEEFKTKEENIHKDDFVSFLKETRKKISSYNKITPLYNVFNNKTLDDIVKKKPTTLGELYSVNGLRPAIIELFGAYLVSSIKSFLDKK